MMRDNGMSIPEYFTCPISLELFSDPVTLCTGQTYDRTSIERWFSAGNLTCPITMQKLNDLSMVPNHTLKHLIDQWYSKSSSDDDNDHHHNHHHHHGFHHDHDCDHVHSYGEDFCKVGCSKKVLFPSLKQALESQDSSLEKKIQVLEEILSLTNDLPRKNEGLIQMGFFSLILWLIFGAKYTQEMMGLIEKSLECILKLMPFSYLGDLNMLMEENKFENFKVLLQEGSYMVKKALCNLIEIVFLQTSSTTKELASKFGNDSKILKSLINYIDDHIQNNELSNGGIKAILSLLSNSSLKQSCGQNLIKERLVHSLVTYILEVEKTNKDELEAKAIRALELVLNMESAKEAFLAKDVLTKGIKALIKMVFRVSRVEGSESAINCLIILCCESMEVREQAICNGILTQLLLLLQSQCSGKTKIRARMLLKVLRSMWAKDECLQ